MIQLSLVSLGATLALLAPPTEPPPTEPSSEEAVPVVADPSPPPTEPAPEVRDPVEVQTDVEQGRGDVPTPEQVQERTQHPRGNPTAPPPSANARPSEGVYAVGSGAVAPLPPPPPPVSPSAIPRLDWRGVGWLAVRLAFTGPIGGEIPARTTVVSFGGGLEGGWRINQMVGIGTGFTRQPHEISRQEVESIPAVIVQRGYMTAWDIAFVRVFAPVRGRVDPYIDLGGGLAFLDPALERTSKLGGTARASLGFDAWLTKNLTLGLAGIYRLNVVEDTLGHSLQGVIELAVHW